MLVLSDLGHGVHSMDTVRDREPDRLHPDERRRPTGAGAPPVRITRPTGGAPPAASLVAATVIGEAFLGLVSRPWR